jgi:hypothetical protein
MSEWMDEGMGGWGLGLGHIEILGRDTAKRLYLDMDQYLDVDDEILTVYF